VPVESREPRELGLLALEHLRRTPARLGPLLRWSVIDSLTMSELQTFETDLTALQSRLLSINTILIDGYKKRVAQSVGSELRHQVENLKKELSDCQDAKRRLADADSIEQEA
jgi:hypothetical protein